MATHKLGKLKFRLQDRGIEFRWGDGEIRRLGLGKKNEEPNYDEAYEQPYDDPADEAEANYSGRFSGEEDEYGEYDDAVDDAYADDGYDDGYAGDYEDDYAEDGYADDAGYDEEDYDGEYADDYADDAYEDGYADDYAGEEAYEEDYGEDYGDYPEEDVEYDEDGNPYYPEDGEYAAYDENGENAAYDVSYPEGVLGTVLQYADENDWVTYLLLFLLPPLGIYLLWRRQRFDQTLRYVLSAASAVWFIVLIILLAMQIFGGKNDTTNPNLPTLAPTIAADASAMPSASPTATIAPLATLGNGGDVAPSATPITGGGSAPNTSNLVWVSSTSLLYHRTESCPLVGADETLSQTTLEAAKQRNKGECPTCYSGTTYYATPNGKHYHTDDHCTNMSNPVVFPVELASAYNKTACPVCVTHEKNSLDEVKTAVYITSSTTDQSGIKVWATRGGKNYHLTKDCRGMTDAVQGSLRDALLAGKTACKTCCAASGTLVWCRSDGTYFHKTSSCSGMKNAKQVTLAEALVLGKKQCPTCLPQTNSGSGSNQTKEEYYVYAKSGGKYYHIKSNCSGMSNADRVTLRSMLEQGRPACPECCGGAGMSVYAAQGGTYYHSYATCNGMENAKQGTLAQALAMGYQRCPRCWGSNGGSQNTPNNGSQDSAYTATKKSIMVYARQDGAYYHTRDNCSGMKNASHITLETAINAGKKACPTCASVANTLIFSTDGGKYYHKIADCSNMKNASRRTIAEALMLGQTACRECWTADVVDGEGDPLPGATTAPKTDEEDVKLVVGTSGIKVYAAQNEKYFHVKEHCGGKTNLVRVALETALNYGKKPCGDCAEVAGRTVYATPNGKYYHSSKSCAGTGAIGGTLAEAVALGFKPCPYCVATSPTPDTPDPSGGGAANFKVGTSGVKVYASASGKYYHANKSHAGSNALYVALETALNYGKTACPECCAIAERTVYSSDGKTYHIRKSHAGSNARSGSFASALAYGMKPCATCFTATDEAGTVTPGQPYSAPASTGVYVDLYADDYYYHVASKCSKTGMSGGTQVTLQFVKDLGYARCPYCNPPSSIE